MAKLVTCRIVETAKRLKELFNELVQHKMGINLHKFFSQCVCVCVCNFETSSIRKKPLRGPSRQQGKSISCRPNGVAKKTPWLTQRHTKREHKKRRREEEGERGATTFKRKFISQVGKCKRKWETHVGVQWKNVWVEPSWAEVKAPPRSVCVKCHNRAHFMAAVAASVPVYLYLPDTFVNPKEKPVSALCEAFLSLRVSYTLLVLLLFCSFSANGCSFCFFFFLCLFFGFFACKRNQMCR